MGGTSGTGIGARRLRPPAALATPPRWLRRLSGLAWALLLALAVLGQAGGLWRACLHVIRADPVFASLGLAAQSEDVGFSVAPATAATRALGLGERSRIVSVGGARVSPDAAADEVARRLAGPEGGQVAIGLAAGGGRVRQLVLTRSAANRAEADPPAARRGKIGFFVLFALLAAAFVAAAVLLRRKRPDDPVSTLLSLAFLAVAASVIAPHMLWSWLGAPQIWYFLVDLWLALLIVAVAAFPDGRFVPRWSGWLLVLAPAAAVLDFAGLVPGALGEATMAGLLAAALTALLLRYRRTPPGLERQQIKWAAFGLFNGLALLAAAILIGLALSFGLVPAWTDYVALGAIYVGLLAIPIGIILSLTRYRLNDADAAIGRSAAYAIVAVGSGVVWAVSAQVMQNYAGAAFGGDGAAVAAGLSALLAALVFVPASERILGWTERRFQPALVRLRDLPRRLGQWQHGDDPEEAAAGALAEIIDGIGAERASLVSSEGRLWAACEAGPEPAQMAAAAADEALCVRLADPGGHVGDLLIGRRGDGAPYSRDQRAAVAMVCEPLADTLRATARRAARNAAVAAALARLEARIEAIERPPGG